MENRGEWIARRAYALWEEAGRPFGQDKYHWDQASAEYDLLEATRASSDGREVLVKLRGEFACQDNRSGAKNRNILIVEDEPRIRHDTVDFLDRAGFRTLEAANAAEALVLLETNIVDMLFADTDMPGSMDGLGLVATVRSRWPSIRIIVTSG